MPQPKQPSPTSTGQGRFVLCETDVPIQFPTQPPPAGSGLLAAEPSCARKTVLFDATHGQANWSQTGFSSREMHSNFAGVMQALCRMGCTCTTTNEKPVGRFLARTRLLVIPPPTGRYHPRKECWLAERASLFTAEEIQDILAFLRDGGRLLAFAYRFGDSFTQANLHDLFAALGCILNNDAVVDITMLRTTHPLRTCFETPDDLLPLTWSRAGVERVRWRSMATFLILPGTTAQPIALSPGGRCISFDRTLRRISFDSRPIGVAGLHHQGRFALFGGPHPFETGTFGLLGDVGNARFLKNTLQWLLEDNPADLTPLRLTMAEPMRWHAPVLDGRGRAFSHLEANGGGQATVTTLERLLRKTGVLKALSRAKWMP